MIARDAADLGLILRQARRTRGLSQGEVAAMVGVTRQWVINAEKGAPTAHVNLILDALRAVGLVVDVVDERTDETAYDVLMGDQIVGTDRG